MRALRILVMVTSVMLLASSGYALDWKWMHERAESLTLNEALALANSNQKNIKYLYILGIKYLAKHEKVQAKKLFERILDTSPQTLEARWGLAAIAMENHNYEESQNALEDIIQTYPEFAPY